MPATKAARGGAGPSVRRAPGEEGYPAGGAPLWTLRRLGRVTQSERGGRPSTGRQGPSPRGGEPEGNRRRSGRGGGKRLRERLRTALLDARAIASFALMDVLAIAAATVALLPLALRPIGSRRSTLAPPRAAEEERRAATGESPAGSH